MLFDVREFFKVTVIIPGIRSDCRLFVLRVGEKGSTFGQVCVVDSQLGKALQKRSVSSILWDNRRAPAKLRWRRSPLNRSSLFREVVKLLM